MEALTTIGTLAVTEAIKELSKKMALFVAEKVHRYYKDTTNKEMIDAGWAFETYLEKVYETYSKSKSILYESEDRELSAFFEPVDLQLMADILATADRRMLRVDGQISFSELLLNTEGIISENIKNFTVRPKESKLLSTKDAKIILTPGSKKTIIGSGGTGKTILMKHFCTSAITQKIGIPVFISLRWFNNIEIGKDPLEKLIYEQLEVFKAELEYEYFKYSLEGDRYIFLFDGFDEVSRNKRSLITEKIVMFSRQYAGNCFVITSRDLGYIQGWDHFELFKICPLNLEQAVRLIDRLDFEEQPRYRFIQELRGGMFYKYFSCASIPLLLSILFLTFVEKASVPESLQKFYEEAFETLLYRHDRKKEGLERLLESNLSFEEFREVFMQFCFTTYFNDEYSFSERRLIDCINEAAKKTQKRFDAHAYSNDLRDIACMLIRDGREFTFLHRSFQEYFAAYYTSQKPDAMQEKFCTAVINLEKITARNSTSFQQTKTMDFLKMLNQVEPQRFETVALMPILSKLNFMSEMSGGDLFELVTSWFYVEVVDDDEHPYVSYSYISNGRRGNFISFNEFYVLFDFYTDLVEKADPELKDAVERRMAEVDDEKLDAIEVRVASYHTVPFGSYEAPFGGDLERDTYEMLMTCFAVCLKRYQELDLRRKAQKGFKDLLSEF